MRGSARSVLGREAMDVAGAAPPRVDCGAAFLRGTDPRLRPVLSMLEGHGLVRRWEGRFGMLGSRGGGFLPASVVGGTGVREMMGRREEGEGKGRTAKDGEGMGGPTDAGDFCGFVSRQRDDVPTYVGWPSNEALCPSICALAGIDVRSGTDVLAASALPGGGWRLEVDHGAGEAGSGHDYDALVLATHDPSLAAATVAALAGAEGAAASSEEEEEEGGTVPSLAPRLEALSRDLAVLSSPATSEEGASALPLFTWSGRVGEGAGGDAGAPPFDAASVPGSASVQYLAREGSKPGRGGGPAAGTGTAAGEVWTAVSTSLLASEALRRHGSTPAAAEEVRDVMTAEVARLLAGAAAAERPGEGRGGNGLDGGVAPFPLEDASAVRWGAALRGRTLGLREDSIALAPWFLCVGGDYVRAADGHETPFEAAALSGLEAGERAAAFFFSGGAAGNKG